MNIYAERLKKKHISPATFASFTSDFPVRPTMKNQLRLVYSIKYSIYFNKFPLFSHYSTGYGRFNNKETFSVSYRFLTFVNQIFLSLANTTFVRGKGQNGDGKFLISVRNVIKIFYKNVCLLFVEKKIPSKEYTRN